MDYFMSCQDGKATNNSHLFPITLKELICNILEKFKNKVKNKMRKMC